MSGKKNTQRQIRTLFLFLLKLDDFCCLNIWYYCFFGFQCWFVGKEESDLAGVFRSYWRPEKIISLPLSSFLPTRQFERSCYHRKSLDRFAEGTCFVVECRSPLIRLSEDPPVSFLACDVGEEMFCSIFVVVVWLFFGGVKEVNVDGVDGAAAGGDVRLELDGVAELRLDQPSQALVRTEKAEAKR